MILHANSDRLESNAYPGEVTQAMVAAMDQGVATVTALAKQVGATFSFHDAGVGHPTGNIRVEDAMRPDEFDDAVKIGVDAVENIDADLLVLRAGAQDRIRRQGGAVEQRLPGSASAAPTPIPSSRSWPHQSQSRTHHQEHRARASLPPKHPQSWPGRAEAQGGSPSDLRAGRSRPLPVTAPRWPLDWCRWPHRPASRQPPPTPLA